MSNFLPVVKLEFINDKQVPAVTSQQLAEAFVDILPRLKSGDSYR